jgi:hypothetical protein
MLATMRRHLDEKVHPVSPAEKIDAFLSLYYGLIIERLAGEIRLSVRTGWPITR